MNERPRELSTGEAIKQLLNESFPDLRCLRCGNNSFALTYDLEGEIDTAARRALVAAAAGLSREEITDFDAETLREVLDGAFITLVCERCGMIERHLRPTLERADKPVKVETTTNDAV